MYKFVKIKCNKTGELHKWMLECNDATMLIEHHEKYMSTEIGKGIKDVFSVATEKTHVNTSYGSAITKYADITGKSLLESAIHIENVILNGKLKTIASHGHVLLRENGSYMVYTSSDEIIGTMLSENMLYPNYTLADIKVDRWFGGVHYYAKIGCLDVCINGNSKWNTPEYAYEMAVEYFNSLKL